MADRLKEVVIPKSEAVFWLDKNGRWHNQHGPFRHKRLIAFFHAAIQKDGDGFYLGQVRDDLFEKVYFPYEDTAHFVFDVIREPEIRLVLNTGRRIRLDPRSLSIKDDILYQHSGEDRIRFTDRGMLKLADLLEEQDGRYFIRFAGGTHPIPGA